MATAMAFCNTARRAVDEELLTIHPLFVPLAPPVVPPTVAASRLYKQHSSEWTALHEGRLTTSRLAAFLGCLEPSGPAARLSVPQHLRGHQHAISAHAHCKSDSGGVAYGSAAELPDCGGAALLLRAGLVPLTPEHIAAHVPPPPTTAATTSAVAALRAGRSGRPLAARSEDAARVAWGSAQEATGILVAINHLIRQRLPQSASASSDIIGERVACTASAAAAAGYAGAAAAAAAASAVSSSSAATAAGIAAGDPRHRFSRVLEVGLCPLETVPLNASYGVRHGDLPAIGASPDGVFVDGTDASVYVLEIKCYSPFKAASKAQLASAPAPPVPTAAATAPGVVGIGAATAAVAAPAAESPVARVSEAFAQQVAVAGDADGHLGAAAVMVATLAAGDAGTNAAGAASADGFSDDAMSAGAVAVDGDLGESTIDACDASAAPAATVPVSSTGAVPTAVTAAASAPVVCRPLGMRVFLAPPPAALPPLYIPQVQLEMLCVGPHCRGAYLVALSAACGAHVFFVPRNDAYIGLLLRSIAAAWRAYGKVGRAPPPAFGGSVIPGFSALLDETVALARRAQLVASVEEAAVQRGGTAGDPWFVEHASPHGMDAAAAAGGVTTSGVPPLGSTSAATAVRAGGATAADTAPASSVTPPLPPLPCPGPAAAAAGETTAASGSSGPDDGFAAALARLQATGQRRQTAKRGRRR